ncbi:hypothetical protein OEZ86_000331 [Tetradesmus obliquus]|nr:hypothetical protein OEZ86_000331 [Tetradesmus obliquus]
MDGSGQVVSCNMLKAKHHESMLVEASMVQQESGQQQQQQQQLHARKRWAQQVQPSWPRLLIPKLVQAGQQHPAAAATQPSGGSSLPWRAQLPPAVRRRNRRALQQLGGPLDAMMLGGMGSILGTGGGSALGGLSGISSLASLAGMTGMGDLTGLGGLAGMLGGGGSSNLADGAATAIGAATPYVLNNGNSVLDQASNAVQQVAQATKTIMHGTAVPMASAGINTASNMGTYMGNGFAEGFGEGYTAANDRRLPYSQGPSVQQQFESQPALYLPQSFSPLGAMANITYPCPVSRVNNIVAPVGTIIGPGIPCGVNLQLVPRAAVPSNRLAPAVVNVIPVASPVPPPAPAPSSPTPIPVTPLPPGGTPPGGGGTLPPVVPPIVNPSPAPGGTPPVVPPIVNPGSPAPGGTPIPTTPPPATPPTTTPGSSPDPGGLPPGVVPPNINPATPASFNGRATRPNYMSVPAPAGYDLPVSVQVTGPYNSMFEAARTGGYSGGGSRMRGSGSIMAQQQQQQQQQQSAGTAWGSLPSFG